MMGKYRSLNRTAATVKTHTNTPKTMADVPFRAKVNPLHYVLAKIKERENREKKVCNGRVEDVHDAVDGS